MKITNAMYLLASSKMKKARRSADATAPFFRAIRETMEEILAGAGDLANKCGYFRKTEGDDKRRLFLVITSDKGLAGSYNHNIVRLAEEKIALPGADSLMFIGYSGRNYFIHRQKDFPDVALEDDYTAPAAEPVMWRAVDYAQHIAQRFRDREVDEVFLVYTKLVNALSSEAECIRLLPLEASSFRSGEKKRREMVYLPSPEDVFTKTVPNYLTGRQINGRVTIEL
jgi:F-type H+-transporting ATPase subunit gamma